MICRRSDDGYFTIPSAGESRAPVQAFCLPIPNRFGLFNYATKTPGGYADFDYFRISDQISAAAR